MFYNQFMKKPFLIEIFIWIIIIIFIIGGCIFAYTKFIIEPNVYVIQFKDIDGITKGSPIRFMGINVGYVRNLKSKDKHVNVQILITKKDMKIPNGTVARVEFYGLGGSKSIELMPPDSSCDVGILTGKTIRLNDVVHEAIGIVEVIEMIEKYVKNINQKSSEKFLIEIKNLKNDKFKKMNNEIDTIDDNISTKVQEIQNKQDEVIEKIKNMNNNVEKLNQFIKK